MGNRKGKFEEACISEWAQDAIDILDYCTSRDVMLVGSSMGGWISFLTALKRSKTRTLHYWTGRRSRFYTMDGRWDE